MSQINILAKLQHYDIALVNIENKLKTRRERLEQNETLAALKQQLEEFLEEKKNFENQTRELEITTSQLIERISKGNSQLYDGSISNVEALETLQTEIKNHKKMLSDFEDKELAILSLTEELDEKISTVRQAKQNEQDSWEEISQELIAEIGLLENHLILAQEQIEISSEELESDTITNYKNLLERKAGIAVTHIQGNICIQCRISIPDALNRRISNSDVLNYCPNCKRILAPQLICEKDNCTESATLQINHEDIEFLCGQHKTLTE